MTARNRDLPQEAGGNIFSDIPDRELLRRAVGSMRLVSDKRQLQKPRWSAVMDMFGLGSTYARIVCLDLGFDPDEKVRE